MKGEGAADWAAVGGLYAVLNLNANATQGEINERYRALSLLFHPDKHHKPDAKEVAEEEYLKIQKAYQVLSDPFLRQVYDVLGIRGLDIRWPEGFPAQTKQKIQEELRELKSGADLEKSPLDDAALTANLSTTVNLCPLTNPRPERIARGAIIKPSFLRRLRRVRIMSNDHRYSMSKRLTSTTTLVGEAHSYTDHSNSGFTTYFGTVKHQFSPRFSGQATIGLNSAHRTILRGTYRDDYNAVRVQLAASPLALVQTASADISLTRRLYHSSFDTAEMNVHAGIIPSLSLSYTSPATISMDLLKNAEDIGSASGLRYVASDYKYGVACVSFVPTIFGEVGANMPELSTRLKVGFELGPVVSSLVVGLGWTGKTNQVSFDTKVSRHGVLAQLEVVAWKRRFTLPLLLSMDLDPRVALYSIIAPTMATALSYHFVVRPRRRARRLEQIRVARRIFEEDSDARNKRNAIIDMLRDVANKYTSLETHRGGLIVQEAWYGVTDEKDGAQHLAIDVTIPIQALVRNSHLYIPGGGSMANLQGFSDPSPSSPKSLRIRYLFRGRPHYANVPEHLPVVLPLSEHSVEGC